MYLSWKEVYKSIVANADVIVADANNGMESAQLVIKYYKLLYDCPNDPGACGLLMSAYSDYETIKKEESHERQ